MKKNKSKSIMMLGLSLGLTPLHYAVAQASPADASKTAIHRLVTAGEIKVTSRKEILISPKAFEALSGVVPVPEADLINYLEQQLESEPQLLKASLMGTVQ